MPKIRNLFPGGNTCYGFYSFYDYMVSPAVERKIILKGGPGVGKSSFMKKMGEDFLAQGYDIEYHWCSSDNESLDGAVIGKQQICILDGTAPHVVDPRFPGAVDEIINLGNYWHQKAIRKNRPAIIELTQIISRCFKRAYQRLEESKIAWEEWESYYLEARDNEAANRNILALARDLVSGLGDDRQNIRHLFAAAITPGGVVSKIDSLIDNGYSLFAVKGNPGTGIKELFTYTWQTMNLSAAEAEFYHNPFDPNSIDIIVLPSSRSVLIDVSGHLFDYAALLPGIRQRRFLDFDQLVRKSVIDAHEKYIVSARERFHSGIRDAIGFIRQAKEYHDELESYYVPAMDFDAMEAMRQELCQQLLQTLGR
ncbi:PRK06851 family protein [Syntrophomonas curvata]